MSHQEFDELASLHALGALDGEDLARFTSHLAGCEECRRAVAEHEKAAEALALSLAPVRPSPAVKEGLLDRVRPRRASSPFGWKISAAACLLAAVALGILYSGARSEMKSREIEVLKVQEELAEARRGTDRLLVQIRAATGKVDDLEKQLASHRKDLERLARMDALIRDIQSQIQPFKGTDLAKGAEGRIVWKGKELYWTSTLPPLVAGKVYELWALVDDKPVPAGTYDAKGNLIAAYWKVPEGAAIKGFAISLEDKAVDAPTQVVMLPAQ
ncbi:MAG TPA: anti-sigma factor [Planctomycetota bacterium]|nr:anti-sigma factor [Planctomycetota bacterium]